MSPENLEAIRKVYEAMNRRDMEALEALAEDHRWRNAPDMPEAGVREGRESTLGYVAALFETSDEIQTEIREVVDLGPEAVIFVVRHRVRGAASGAEAERDEVHLWRARDGRVVAMEEFLTLDEARAAA